jgi:hypothetical protein
MDRLTIRELVDALRGAQPTKAYYGVADIMERYDCSHVTAEKYIREAKYLTGGKLGKGKLLPAELAYWENYINGRDIRLDASEREGN